MARLILIILTILFTCTGFSQNKFGAHGNIVYLPVNKENDLLLLKDKQFNWAAEVGIFYQDSIPDLFRFRINYSWMLTEKKTVREGVRISETGDFLYSVPVIYQMRNHFLDFGYVTNYTSDEEYFIIGPSIAFINRDLNYDYEFHDLLASVGVGAFGTVYLPLTNSKLSSQLSMALQLTSRIIHSVYFDKGNRNLDGYSQFFWMVNAGIVLEWNPSF